MPVIEAESRRQAMERAVSQGGYNWAAGGNLTWTPDAEEAAENEQRMVRRYRDWAASSLVTYAPSKYESANRNFKDMPFETINPIDDTVTLPEPHYDLKDKKWVVPKNVFDKNVVSRRRFLYEIDGMALADQKKLLEPLLEKQIIQRVVFSGHKSLHCVIEETDEPEASPDDEMYKWVWRFMAYLYFRDMRFKDVSLPMKIDNSWIEVVDNRCGHPSRTTRSPFAVRKDITTGMRPVEQKLLYFENVRADSGWRAVYGQVKKREEAERERSRRRAQHDAFKNRHRGKKIPNEAARRFMGGDTSDGWKHAQLGSAVASLIACGYRREEVARIFSPYKKELQVFAMRSYDYFERKDRR